jgi:nucleoside-triphosphatase THEP1
MIKIVTGKINSYKTTRLFNHYQDSLLGDGFIARKMMKNDLVYGYDLIQLSNGYKIPFIRRDIFDDTAYEVIYKLGPYHFFESAFLYVEEKIDEFIKQGISPIYLDEISLLELQDQGFHQVLLKLLEQKIDLVLVIREDLLEQVLTKYKIEDYELI